jgi:serine/threonine protein kinase
MVGRTVAQYQILEKLGAGGMGEIYKAQDTRLNRLVAIKVLPTERSSDPDRRKRFLLRGSSRFGPQSSVDHYNSRCHFGERCRIHGDGTGHRQDAD